MKNKLYRMTFLLVIFIVVLSALPAAATENAGLESEPKRIYISNFSGYTGSNAPGRELSGQSFFIFPGDEYADETLAMLKNAYACVIEESKGRYTIVHTAQYEKKADWRKKWLEDGVGKRFVFVAYMVNNKTSLPETYDFEMKSFFTVAYGFDPSKEWGGTGTEGAFAGKEVFFYNVDFENCATASTGSWATPGFTPMSYFTVGAEDPNPIPAEAKIKVKDDDSIAGTLRLEEEERNRSVTTLVSEKFIEMDFFDVMSIIMVLAAIIILIVCLYKKYKKKLVKKTPNNSKSSSGHHGHHRSDNDRLFGSENNTSKSSHHHRHHHHHSSDDSDKSDNSTDKDIKS